MDKNKIYVALLVILLIVIFGGLAAYYLNSNFNNSDSVISVSAPVPLNVSSQDQSSGWNIYSSPQFQVTFKYPNFAAFNSIDGGISSQGKADASISIRPDNNTSVNDFINAQVVNGGSSVFSNSYSNPTIEPIEVNGQSGDLVVSDGTLTGDTGRDVLIVKYPKTIAITNTVGGTQNYSYMVVTFTDMNVGVIREIIATMQFLKS